MSTESETQGLRPNEAALLVLSSLAGLVVNLVWILIAFLHDTEDLHYNNSEADILNYVTVSWWAGVAFTVGIFAAMLPLLVLMRIRSGHRSRLQSYSLLAWPAACTVLLFAVGIAAEFSTGGVAVPAPMVLWIALTIAAAAVTRPRRTTDQPAAPAEVVAVAPPTRGRLAAVGIVVTTVVGIALCMLSATSVPTDPAWVSPERYTLDPRFEDVVFSHGLRQALLGAAAGLLLATATLLGGILLAKTRALKLKRPVSRWLPVATAVTFVAIATRATYVAVEEVISPGTNFFDWQRLSDERSFRIGHYGIDIMQAALFGAMTLVVTAALVFALLRYRQRQWLVQPAVWLGLAIMLIWTVGGEAVQASRVRDVFIALQLPALILLGVTAVMSQVQRTDRDS